VHTKFIYDAYLKGMDAVLVVGCHPADCHYISGVQQQIKSIPITQKGLEKIGIDPARLKLDFASAAEGAAFASLINGYNDEITRLGHLELTEEQKEQLTTMRDKRTVPKKKGKAGSAATADDGKDTASE
jgi:coenzyme F420-reducing hydrogenase delta subunit